MGLDQSFGVIIDDDAVIVDLKIRCGSTDGNYLVFE